MTSFKSGSGNLDFGSSSDRQTEEESAAEELSDSGTKGGAERSSGTADETGENRTEPGASAAEYPYFVRRSNVTDEREQRIEVHLRPEISGREAAFRTELAAALETDMVPKTDAREFALKFAFQHPEQVAELMRAEGFGVLDR